MAKSVTVFTNDPNRPSVRLKIAGEVEEFAVIDPKRVRLEGLEGTYPEAIVTIVPKKDYPFKITGMRVRTGRNVGSTLRENAGGGYELTVVNRRKTKGVYYDTVILTTDSTIQKELMINIFGKIN